MAKSKPTDQSHEAKEIAEEAQSVVEQVSSRSSSRWLTFEYGLAMGSLVASTLLIVNVLVSLFGGWAGNGATLKKTVGGWTANLLGLDMVTASTGLVTASVGAVLLALLAFFVFGRVSRAIQNRPGYTKRAAYRVITYGSLAALVVPALVLFIKLVSILVSSLIFIGVSGASRVYKSLYLAEFLPYLLGLAVVVVSVWLVGRIVQGRNSSKLASSIIFSVALAALVASTITVAIQARDDYRVVPLSPAKSESIETDVFRY